MSKQVAISLRRHLRQEGRRLAAFGAAALRRLAGRARMSAIVQHFTIGEISSANF
jgi:hypothetical protein